MTDDRRSRHTPGPWQLIIDDTGGKWTGWPSGVSTVEEFNDSGDPKDIVRGEGFRPRDWDIPMTGIEIHANAVLIAHAPLMYDYIERRAQEGCETAQKIILSICEPDEILRTTWTGAIE